MQSRDSGAAQDPVCGMSVQADSPHKATYKGQEFGFGSVHRLTAFKQDPEKYTKPVAGEKPGAAPAPLTRTE
jgi:Cu+-exporting ATPase